MKDAPPFTQWTLLGLGLVLACAGGARSWYLVECTASGRLEPALLVQGRSPRVPVPDGQANRPRTPPTELDNLAGNVADQQWFGGLAPLANDEEQTAHVAPGYPCLLGAIASLRTDAGTVLRWLQAVLGTLTVGCYFFFARRAFGCTFIALFAGMLTALHPFWIVNTAELNDGVLTSFLFGVALMLGTRGSQTGAAFTSLLFGLALAGLVMVRAACLPFALVALLWFLWHCRRLPFGWFAGFLALIGLANGLAPWCLRNYVVFEQPVPIVTSTYLHLWIGNNPHATGAALDESALRAALPEERRELLAEPNQAKRYNRLAHDVWQEVRDHPAETVTRRIDAMLAFVFGERWFKQKQLGLWQDDADTVATPPAWLTAAAEGRSCKRRCSASCCSR